MLGRKNRNHTFWVVFKTNLKSYFLGYYLFKYVELVIKEFILYFRAILYVIGYSVSNLSKSQLIILKTLDTINNQEIKLILTQKLTNVSVILFIDKIIAREENFT